MQNKKNKVLLSIIFLMIILVGAIVCFNLLKEDSNSENITKVYTRNDYGLFRDENEISEEEFDEYGNLTYYKQSIYIDGYDREFSGEYNFSYKYDENQRLIKAFYDENNYIDIEYDDENHISKLIDNSNGLKYEYNFEYEDDIINLIKSYKTALISYDGLKQQETLVKEKGYIKIINYEGKNYILYREFDEFNTTLTEIICEKKEENINYSNLHSILNITYPYYKNVDNSFSNNFLSEIIPVFNGGNVVYINSFNSNLLENNYELNDEEKLPEVVQYIKENNI